MNTPGEQVGAAVDDAVQQTQQNAQAEIDAAKRDADTAAANAKRIADAAISTELGGQIQQTRQEFETWRTAADQRLAETAETTKALQAQSVETTTLLGSIRALLTPAPAPAAPQTPTQNPAMVPMAENSEKTAQKEQQKVAAETPAPAPKRKRAFL